jgi:TRAP-type C4-dicarboxylate transport system substrate-binding protein
MQNEELALMCRQGKGANHRPSEKEVVMNEHRPLRRTGLAIVAALGLVLAGCTTSEANKAGGSGEPLVLRMANGYSSLEYEPAVDFFVRRVEELSEGALRIEVVDEWGRNNDSYPPENEQTVVRDVAAGEVELAWVGTRIFDTLGVGSFQALTTPMLIDSYPLEQAVIDSDIPDRMMERLPEIGVIGLAILADGLRKPIAVGQPLLGPDDWRGITFQSFRSDVQAQAIEALGAQPTDLLGAALDEGLESGQIQGFEKNLLIYQINEMQLTAPFVTANVNLWPQTVALIADPDQLSGLTEQQRGWLEEAAHDAAAASTGLMDPHEQQLVTGLCNSGAAFVNASDADLAALRDAFAPLYAELEQDPQTAAFIADIEELKRQTPPAAALTFPDDCETAAPLPTGTKTTRMTPLDGEWEVTLTREELLDAIARNGNDLLEDNPGNYGHQTLVFDRGDMCGTDDGVFSGGNTYAIDGGTLTVFTPEGFRFTTTWSVYRDTLTFENDPSRNDGVSSPMIAKPWRRVGPGACPDAGH